MPATAAAAQAAGQTAESCKDYSARTDWGGVTQSIGVDRFAMPGVTLTAVNVTRTVDIYSDLSVTSYNNGPTTISGTINGQVRMNASNGFGDLTDPLAETVNETMPSGSGAFQKRYDTPLVNDSARLTAPADLAAWTGSGQNVFTGVSSATDTVTASGNYDKSVRTIATMKVCVTYEYLETYTVCIGDYVWYDANKNGIQDTGELPVAGRAVTVVDANGVVLGSATTDANGRWTLCGLEPSVKCEIRVSLPSGYSLSPVNQGTNEAVDSDAVASGAGAAIPCVTPPRGNDFTFDVGISPNPTAIDQPVAAPAPAPAVLRIGKRSTAAVIRSGGTATFFVTVRNRGTVAVADVTVCDTPPRLLAFSSKPRGSFFRAGKLCWTIPTLAAGQSRTFSYTMRASSVATRSCVTNSVTATAAVGGSATTRAGLCIRPTRLRALPLAG